MYAPHQRSLVSKKDPGPKEANRFFHLLTINTIPLIFKKEEHRGQIPTDSNIYRSNMKKAIVIYYSNTGSNRYLAEKIADRLECDIEEIKPRPNLFPVLMLLSALKASWGIKSLKHNLEEYDRIILCGPIWMGKLISPLRGFINRYRACFKQLYFVTCCGSGDAVKNDKFGHATVFKLVREILGDTCVLCEAFPIGLVLPEEKQKDGDAIMKTRLSDTNFSGDIQKRFDNFIKKISG
jgi:flavodoxin